MRRPDDWEPPFLSRPIEHGALAVRADPDIAIFGRADNSCD